MNARPMTPQHNDFSGDLNMLRRRYVELLQQHILKENAVLFPMGDQVMVDHDDEQIRQCYEGQEREMGGGEHARLIGLAEAMSAEA